MLREPKWSRRLPCPPSHRCKACNRQQRGQQDHRPLGERRGGSGAAGAGAAPTSTKYGEGRRRTGVAASGAARGEGGGAASHGHLAISRQGSTGQVPIQCNVREREDVADERSAAIDGCGTLDQPLRAARIGRGAVDDGNSRANRGDERARHYEDPDRVGIALGIKPEQPRQIGSGSGNTVGAWRKRESNQIGTHGRIAYPRRRQGVVRNGQSSLTRIGNRWYYLRSNERARNRETNDRGTGGDSHISRDCARTGTGHRRPGQDRIGRQSRPQVLLGQSRGGDQKKRGQSRARQQAWSFSWAMSCSSHGASL